MANDRTLLVTGASGHLGRRVLELLIAAGTRSIVATTRYPDRLADFARRGVLVRWADFDKPESLQPAFAGAHRMLLVSTDVVEDNVAGPVSGLAGRLPPRDVDATNRRRGRHATAVAAAEAAGIEHIVYTSLARADTSRLAVAADHVATERRIASTRLSYTILRTNVFTEVLLMVLPSAISSATLLGLPGDGGVAYITRDDSAFAAATALISSTGRSTLELTGSEVVRRAPLARTTTDVTGRDVFYVALPADELSRRWQAAGLPASYLLPFEQATVDGQFAFTTTDFLRLTGRGPTEVHDFLAANRHALVRAA
ncbi:MAG: NAD(P)-dependent oxidoreductase [Labilithrix sp.]|nr:NAD(P)-dependent oxidoreductase [Labilithrix sp.]